MITAEYTMEQIQAAVDAGGRVEFAPGVYEDVHLKIKGPVHLVGYGAVLTGGKRIRWTEEADGVLSCEAPMDKPLRELVVGGGLRMRCRLPETGYLQYETDFPHRWLGTTKGGWEIKPTDEQMVTMQVKKGGLDGLTLDSAEATIVHSWSDSLLTVQEAGGDVIVFEQAGDMPIGSFGKRDYCLWNVPEAFHEPGTFFHDVPGGRLYYRPLPGEDVHTEAYLPQQTSVFYADTPVESVEIEGFELTATAAPRVKAGFGAYSLSGAIDMGDVRHGRFHHLTIRAVGGYGIRTTGQLEDVRVDHCELSDLGAGGLRIGSGRDIGKSVVEDCSVHHIGRYQPSAIGIAASNCHIRHNEVCHTSYSAINCGGDGFIVEKNLLHDTMEVLNDGAAIYSFGSHDGIMRGNLAYGIHPVNGHALRIAYYLDEVSSGWLVEGNVAADCDFPNHNHMCGRHTYRSNLFVNERGGLRISLQRSNDPTHYEGNVFSAGGEIVFTMTEGALGRFEGNRYHSLHGTVVGRVNREDEILSEAPLEMSGSNRPMDAVHLEKDVRIFEAAGLKIDLTDVGPRKE